MKTKIIQREIKLMQRLSFMAAVLLAALSVLVYAPTADADMAADAVIINVVSVDYTDASGNNTFQAEAAATVTVNLVEAAVTISGRPTPAAHGASAGLPAEQNLQSGDTGEYLYALTANTNGDDEYFLDIAIDATANVTAQSVTTELLNPDESLVTTNPVSVTLGASVIVGVNAGDILLFPGGTLTGIAAGDVVVIGVEDYLVSSVSNGSPANYVGSLTPEVQGQLVLSANPNGGNVVPSFVVGDIGTLVYEQVLIRVSVTAEANIPGNDGTVDVDIQVTTDAGGSDNLSEVQDVTTTYTGLDLAILKEVRNLTNSGAFGATATGITGNILEYRVTITNNGGSADNVIVTDAVPDYTTLVLAGTDFATYTGPASAAGSVSSAADGENPNDVSGANSGTTAGSSLAFYVGDAQDGTSGTGGMVLTGETFVISYQVTID